MPASLGAALGERFVAGGRVYYAAPTPERLAAAPLDAIRAAKLGYGDHYEEALAGDCHERDRPGSVEAGSR